MPESHPAVEPPTGVFNLGRVGQDLIQPGTDTLGRSLPACGFQNCPIGKTDEAVHTTVALRRLPVVNRVHEDPGIDPPDLSTVLVTTLAHFVQDGKELSNGVRHGYQAVAASPPYPLIVAHRSVNGGSPQAS